MKWYRKIAVLRFLLLVFLFILALMSSYYKRMLEYSYKIKENQNPKNSSYFSSGNWLELL